MSVKYRSALFGQGNETELEASGHHVELIPELSDSLGGYYPIALPLDAGDYDVPSDFTAASAARWFWRVRTWTASMHFVVSGEGTEIDMAGEFEMPGFSTAPDGNTLFSDEAQLNSPTNGYNAHYRQWRGSVNLGDENSLSCVLAIGSYDALRGGDPTPALNELFHELSDGTFAPRILVSAEVVVNEGDDTVVIPAYSKEDNPYTDGWDLTIDGILVPGAIYSSPYAGTVSYTVELVPTTFWSWDGIWDTGIGAALSDPRV